METAQPAYAGAQPGRELPDGRRRRIRWHVYRPRVRKKYQSCEPLLELYQQHNLKCMVNAFPGTEDDMQPLLEFARTLMPAW